MPMALWGRTAVTTSAQVYLFCRMPNQANGGPDMPKIEAKFNERQGSAELAYIPSSCVCPFGPYVSSLAALCPPQPCHVACSSHCSRQSLCQGCEILPDGVVEAIDRYC